MADTVETVETVDLSSFETGVGELVQKLKFPPTPAGEMPDMQKQMMVIQFVTLALMN